MFPHTLTRPQTPVGRQSSLRSRGARGATGRRKNGRRLADPVYKMPDGLIQTVVNFWTWNIGRFIGPMWPERYHALMSNVSPFRFPPSHHLSRFSHVSRVPSSKYDPNRLGTSQPHTYDSPCFSVSTKQSVGSVITRCSGNRPELSEICVVGRVRETFEIMFTKRRERQI